MQASSDAAAQIVPVYKQRLYLVKRGKTTKACRAVGTVYQVYHAERVAKGMDAKIEKGRLSKISTAKPKIPFRGFRKFRSEKTKSISVN